MLRIGKSIFTVAVFLVVGILVICFSRNTGTFGIKEKGTIRRISIFTALSDDTDIKNYQRAIDSMKCYAKIHGYNFTIAYDKDYADICKQKDKFFRRHCIVSHEVQYTDYLLFIDADIGVVNPNRKIEEFINDRFYITFYDRFFNAEIGMASYILKNSKAGIDFITEFANYETKLPNSFHATDNGAIHAFVISKLFPDRKNDYRVCLKVWNKSRNFGDVFTYENCIRSMMGISEVHGDIRIIRKGSAWLRDNWLTNSLWSPETDFMIHLWKTKEMRKYTSTNLPIRMTIKNRYTWYDPIVGDFNFDQCTPGNFTWNYDKNLITTGKVIKQQLEKLHSSFQSQNFEYLAKITRFINAIE